MSESLPLPLRFGVPLFRLNWCLLAVWLLLGTFGRAPLEALFYCAVGLHVLIAFLEPALAVARVPMIRWPALALAAIILVASLVVSANTMREAAEHDVTPAIYESGGGAIPFDDPGSCDDAPPEV